MTTEVSITIYDITQQGYYHYARSDSPKFGSVHSTLKELYSWAEDKNIEDTLLSLEGFDTEKNHPTLLASINQHTDKGWLLTLWTQVPDHKGKVLSISRQRRVGDAKYTTNEVAKDTIAGFPSYYWFLPERSILATIQVNSFPTNPSGLQAHLQHFMSRLSNHAVKTKVSDDGEIKIAGYRECSISDTFSLTPRFRIKIRRKPSDIDILRRKVEQIHRFERLEKFTTVAQANIASWQKRIPKKLRGTLSENHIQNIKTEQSFKTEINLEQLNFLIQDWEDNLQNIHMDIDYSFHVKKESKPYRLGSSIARHKFPFELNYDEKTGIVKPESLIHELERHMDIIIKNLIDD